jgi:hypothetical protein
VQHRVLTSTRLCRYLVRQVAQRPAKSRVVTAQQAKPEL